MDESVLEKEATLYALREGYSIPQTVESWCACLSFLLSLFSPSEEKEKEKLLKLVEDHGS